MNRWYFIGFAPIVVYLLLPLLFYIFPWYMQCFLFLSFVKVPFRDLTNLSHYGVNSLGRNFYLKGKNGLRLGCWHILPQAVAMKYRDSMSDTSEMVRLLRILNYPVIVYLHGNSFDRAASSRCGLYNVLTGLDFHVLAVDYRGYGDSNGSPSEDGLIEDGNEIYTYARSYSGSNNIYLWGHSLGTAVATAVAMDLSLKGSPPVGLILESPFNNLSDVITNHWFAAPFRFLPWFNRMVVESLRRSGLNMDSDVWITKVACPILIMHAEDDRIIPLLLAHKLRDSALAAGRDVTYVEFDARRCLQHKFIHLADELPKIVRNFTKKCIPRVEEKA